MGWRGAGPPEHKMASALPACLGWHRAPRGGMVESGIKEAAEFGQAVRGKGISGKETAGAMVWVGGVGRSPDWLEGPRGSASSPGPPGVGRLEEEQPPQRLMFVECPLRWASRLHAIFTPLRGHAAHPLLRLGNQGCPTVCRTQEKCVV